MPSQRSGGSGNIFLVMLIAYIPERKLAIICSGSCLILIILTRDSLPADVTMGEIGCRFRQVSYNPASHMRAMILSKKTILQEALQVGK